MSPDRAQLKRIVEAALLAADGPLSLGALAGLFDEAERPPAALLREVLGEIETDTQGRGFRLAETAGGWRFQVPPELGPWVGRLWAEKPPRYSRALLETLAVVAYRQPVTRGDIEEIRGVAVSSNIMRTLQEREWVRVVGHRDVPGKPELFATTRQFLDYFNLKSLEQLPSLAEIKDFEQIDPELPLPIDGTAGEEPPDEHAQDDESAAAEEPAAGTDATEPQPSDDRRADGAEHTDQEDRADESVPPDRSEAVERSAPGEPG